MAADLSSPVAVHQNLLDRLEPQVNLPAWLIARAFQLAPLQPDPGELIMTGPALEVFHLRKDVDRGGWTYTNTSEPTDRGTVVDFMIRRDGATPETCVHRLAGCVTRSLTPEGLAYQEALRDRGNTLHPAEALHVAAVKAEREATRQLERLGVERTTLDEWRFGRVRGESDISRLLRDPGTLAHSRYRQTDQTLVIVERPIDALAYERTHGKQQACYVYLGDNPSHDTKQKLAHLIADLPDGMKVVSALGRDRRGDELSTDIKRLCGASFVRQPPEFGGRWSEQMQVEHRHRRSLQRHAGLER
jgi:hypothetical protein